MDSTSSPAAASDLGALARADGTFAMLAIDQRESLRTMLVAAGLGGSDADLTRFKVSVARSLSAVASGILVDRDYGLEALSATDAVAPGCGLIVAVDRLIQQPGGALEASELDRAAMTEDLLRHGTRALKLLVVWRPDQPAEPRRTMVADFIDGCRRLGLVSVLEGLVQVPGVTSGAAFDDAILDAAREFAEFEPDLYKTHVPTHGAGSPDEITRRSAEVSDAIRRPWVVLSAGVPVDLFPAAVAAAGDGGASGFLAGRGVWGPSIRASNPDDDLATAARRRLSELASIAAAHSRPWTAVASESA
jgi:sulfofructosephosphate aldolase